MHVQVRLIASVAIAPVPAVPVGATARVPVFFFDTMGRQFTVGKGVSSPLSHPIIAGAGNTEVAAGLDVFSNEGYVVQAAYDKNGTVLVTGLCDGVAVLKLWLPSQLVDPAASLATVIMGTMASFNDTKARCVRVYCFCGGLRRGAHCCGWMWCLQW